MKNNIDEDILKQLEKAKSNILRGNSIEDAIFIIEKVVMDNYIIACGRENILKIATRQVINFLQENKNKRVLDVVREKVKVANENNELKTELETYKKIKECYMTQQDDEYSNWYVCSNCKEDFYWGEEPEDIKNSNVKYCPFCGCKIKEIIYIEESEVEKDE